jgi:hypothetical protein
MYVNLGVKLCRKCKQRKPTKGGWQSKIGSGFVCAGCRSARPKA